MFNAPRAAQRYGSTPGNGFGTGSFVDDNPLGGSVYDDGGLDPWSAGPSPSATPAPQATATLFNSVIADATVPIIYTKAYNVIDPTGSGEVSISSLTRVLSTSALPASTIDRIVNLVSSRPRVSKLEFYVALALAALAQAGEDISVEQVASLSSQNTLPEPALDLESLQQSVSSFLPPTPRQNSEVRTQVLPPTFSAVAEDPWNTNSRGPGPAGADAGKISAAPSNLGTGLPTDWWKKLSNVTVNLMGQQGFILNRYTVYEVGSDRGSPVMRRYSEFVYLWDILTRRYPFRLFPSLPPKRVGPDDFFLEQRRRGLVRSLNFVCNHPVIKEDALLNVFLTEPAFDEWRKRTSVSLDEESASKRVDRSEEMSIPSDFEDKIATLRKKVVPLIDQWQRICILADKIIKRREAAAVRAPAFFRARRASAHNHFHNSTIPASPLSTSATLTDSIMDALPTFNSAITSSLNEQSDLSRLTNTLRAVVEENERCWRGDDCELSNGVRNGLEQAALHAARHSEMEEARTRRLLDTTLESLKTQRDLYIALRDLFIRHDRLSIDQVERLKKRVDANALKAEGVRAAQKDGWQDEVEKYTALVEKDQLTIAAQLSRRVFIRACLWSELRIVLHNRENTMMTVMLQAFAREEADFSESALSNWSSLQDAVEGMPFE